MEISTLDINTIKTDILHMKKGKRLFICGVTPLGKSLADWMDIEGISYDAFVDRKGKANWTDKKVYTYAELISERLDGILFIVTQYVCKEDVIEELVSIGVNRESIVTFLSMKVFDVICMELKKGIDTSRLIDDNWHNIYEGERCFIIGNGPSLRISDLERISGEYSFGTNMIYKNLKQINWKPSFYVVTDRTMAEEFISESSMANLLETVGIALFDMKTAVYDKYANSQYDNLYFIKTMETGIKSIEEGTDFFSDDVVTGFYRASTVTFVSLQLACYMGFKEIYLLGIDFSYSNVKHYDGRREEDKKVVSNHAEFCPEPEWYISNSYENVDQMLAGYLAAKKYTDNHQIKIYNATRGGKLEVYPRVNFDTLFQ